MDMKSTLGTRIRNLRREKKMTQSALAELLFVSDKTISKWEQDRSEPEIDIIMEISNIFDVTLDYLLTGSTDKRKIKGGRVIYNDDGTIHHYIGEDGDRLFTRNEVTTILNKRIKRYEQSILNTYNLKSVDDLKHIIDAYNHKCNIVVFRCRT